MMNIFHDADESEAEVLWEPETSLPAPLHESDTRHGQMQRDEEPGLSKQVLYSIYTI